VLAHDLRNSLQSIGFGAALLAENILENKTARHVESIRLSCERMQELIGAVLDFSRGRLNGGIPVVPKKDNRIGDELRHVIAEVQSAHRDRVIKIDMDIGEPVICDRRRIGQMLGNLLTNAVTHGDPHLAVTVSARADAQSFELSVTNGAPEIFPDVLHRLFQPFCKKKSTSSAPTGGLGLGLYIAAEIAHSHGGRKKRRYHPPIRTALRFPWSPPLRHRHPVGIRNASPSVWRNKTCRHTSLPSS
jgi:signal transduction histidine kinase